ncbi:MAG: metallophosphoesterase [Candidatus Krumholzibacteriia bacterium]
MQLAWATDLHCDHLVGDELAFFCARVVASPAEALLLGGDISNGRDLREHLATLRDAIPLPVYVVLGNHDYYGRDIASVRAAVQPLDAPPLCWLPAAGCVGLDDNLALVGVGGWGDARNGDFSGAPLLTDYLAIADLEAVAGRGNLVAGFKERAGLQRRLQELGDQAAATLRPALAEAVSAARHVLVLTHVPPFPEAAWHEGRLSTETWQPGFTCKAVGDLLLQTARDNPRCEIVVLCGHTHGSGRCTMLPNLEIVTAAGDYGTTSLNLVAWDRHTITVALAEDAASGV